MPIKFPGNKEYRIPGVLKEYQTIIEKIANVEQKNNPIIEQCYAYLTIDKKILTPGITTRKGGIHVDGFQGDRINPKLPADHSYIIYDNHPTIFYNQPFYVGENWKTSCHDYFKGFEKQKKHYNQITYHPYQILLISAYCLHEAPLVLEEYFRTFFRLSYTVRKFDRLGNAHNPLFDYHWEMKARNTPSSLSCPI